jgi:hypothetical protein
MAIRGVFQQLEGANSRSTSKMSLWVLSNRTILTLSCRHPPSRSAFRTTISGSKPSG